MYHRLLFYIYPVEDVLVLLLRLLFMTDQNNDSILEIASRGYELTHQVSVQFVMHTNCLVPTSLAAMIHLEQSWFSDFDVGVGALVMWGLRRDCFVCCDSLMVVKRPQEPG